jgi:hypothetical protein
MPRGISKWYQEHSPHESLFHTLSPFMVLPVRWSLLRRLRLLLLWQLLFLAILYLGLLVLLLWTGLGVGELPSTFLVGIWCWLLPSRVRIRRVLWRCLVGHP